MKKATILTALCFVFISCSTDKCIKVYITAEIKDDIGEKTITVLADKKLKVNTVLNIYMGRTRGTWTTQAKSFDHNDYQILSTNYKKDSTDQYWKKNDSKYLGFDALIKSGLISKFRDSVFSPNSKAKIYYYALSKPLYIKSKKHALFSLFKSGGPKQILEDCVIIMEKKSGKWVFLEKVDNFALH